MPLPILRTSERTDYKRCPWKWHHGWVQGLTERDPKPTAADFGSGLHLCLAEYYKPGKRRGVDPRVTWGKWIEGMHGQFVRIDEFDPEAEGQAKYEDARLLGEQILEGYLAEYGKDEEVEDVIAPEQRFSIKIPHPTISGRYVVQYVGTLDCVYRSAEDGKPRILETKSTNRNLDRYLVDVAWAEQFGAYPAVATQSLRAQGLIGPRERVRGMTYNLIARKPPDDRPRDTEGYATNTPQKKHYVEQMHGFFAKAGIDPSKLKVEELAALAGKHEIVVTGERSARQPTKRFLRETFERTPEENRRQIRRIGEEALHMRTVRDGRLPLLKTPTQDCGWQCEFAQLCEIDENGDDYEYYRDTVYKTNDPYADHRQGARNSKQSVAMRRRTAVK